MRPVRILAHAVALSIVAGAVSPLRLAAQDPTPPVAKTIAKIDTLHGDIRTDNYFWIREKTNPDVISYLNAENAYTAARMKHTEALQQKLYDEMLGRIKETDLSVPFRDNGYWYYNRTEKGKSYPIRLRKKGSLTAAEEILIDENALAAGKKFSQLGGFAVSPGASRLAYLHDTSALRVYTLYVKDLRTGALLGDSISSVVPSVAWANDTVLFYQTADSARRSNAVWRHVPPNRVGPASRVGGLVEENGIVGPSHRGNDGRDRIAEQGAGAEVFDVERVDAKRGGVVQVGEPR